MTKKSEKQMIKQSIITDYIESINGLNLLLCSHSRNDVPREPQRNVSIAAVRSAVHPSTK